MQRQTLQQMHGMLTNLNGTNQSGRGVGHGGSEHHTTRVVLNGREGRGNGSNNQHQQNQVNWGNQNQTQNEPGNQARVTSDYSWIHGYIDHTDTECNHPAYGHIPHATLTKYMGESNNHVPPVLWLPVRDRRMNSMNKLVKILCHDNPFISAIPPVAHFSSTKNYCKIR